MTHTAHTPASGKTALAPDIREMDERSARAWTERMAVRALGAGRYEVESQSDATYTVDLRSGGCTCPDHEHRGGRCKHVRRVAIQINQGLTPPPGRVRGICLACGEAAFVPEGDAPELCLGCHLAPGDTVRDAETGDLLVVAAVTEHRAGETAIEGTDYTVASYPANRTYDADDLVVEVVYPFSGDPDAAFEDRRRYSFPMGRLDRR